MVAGRGYREATPPQIRQDSTSLSTPDATDPSSVSPQQEGAQSLEFGGWPVVRRVMKEPRRNGTLVVLEEV